MSYIDSVYPPPKWILIIIQKEKWLGGIKMLNNKAMKVPEKEKHFVRFYKHDMKS